MRTVAFEGYWDGTHTTIRVVVWDDHEGACFAIESKSKDALDNDIWVRGGFDEAESLSILAFALWRKVK